MRLGQPRPVTQIRLLTNHPQSSKNGLPTGSGTPRFLSYSSSGKSNALIPASLVDPSLGLLLPFLFTS